MKKVIIATMLLLYGISAAAQAPDIVINGVAADDNCMYIRTVHGSLDTMQGKWVGIYHAEIVGDCLELSIMYGGCKAEMEFVTDNTVITTQSYTMRFLLKYLTNADNPCKDTQRTKLRFDLLPYKNLRPGSVLYLSFIGSPLKVGYRQMQ